MKFQTTIPNIQIVYIRAEVSRKWTYYAYTQQIYQMTATD